MPSNRILDPAKSCDICGNSFALTVKHPKKVTCSPKCGAARHSHKYGEFSSVTHPDLTPLQRFRLRHPDAPVYNPEVYRVWCKSMRGKVSQRKRHLKGIYNLTSAEQGGVCAACHKPETLKDRNGRVKRLAVDHKHGTDIVRGLTCGRCNLAIGFVLDDPEIARAIARYLENAEPFLAKAA